MNRRGCVPFSTRRILIALLAIPMLGCAAFQETAGDIGQRVQERIRTQTLPLHLTIAQDLSPGLGLLKPGQAIPPGLAATDFPFTETCPSMDDVKEEIGGAIADSLLNVVEVRTVRLDAVELSASAGNFASIRSIDLTVTLPDSSVVVFHGQRYTDSTLLTFVPENGPDILAMIQRYGGRKVTLKIRVAAEGNMPKPEPVFNVAIRATAIINL